MRRPRLCFANADPGGLGEPSVPTTGRCLKWLDETGEGWAKACLDGEKSSRLRSEVRSQGRRSRCDGASERRFCYYQGASFGAPSPLKVEGRKLTDQLARRREDEKSWLFEIESENCEAR